jgi:hypothetical protein
VNYSNILPGSNGQPPRGIAAFDAAVPAPEYTPLPPGIYSARVQRGECYITKAGDDAYRMRFEVTDGLHAGKTVVRTWTFGEKALPYSRRDLATFGLTSAEQLQSPFPEVGRDYFVRLTVALQRGNDGTERNDIKRIDIVRVDESPAAAFQLPGNGNGGAK